MKHILTIEDIKGMTTLEIFYALTNKYNELAKYVVDSELMTEEYVVKTLKEWLNNGTLNNIISNEILGGLNDKVNQSLKQMNDVLIKIEKEKNHVPLIPQPVSLKESLTYPSDVVNSLPLDLLCHVPYSKRTANFQGLANKNGYLYVGEHSRENTNVTYVHKMSYNGDIIETKENNFGHIASICMRVSNQRFYIASGGQDNKTIIWEYDFETNQIINTIDLSHLNSNALVSVDNVNDQLIVVTCKEYTSPIQIHKVGFDGVIKETIEIQSLGVPQGLSVFEEQIYYMTGSHGTTGKLNILDLNGNLLHTHTFYKEVYVGYDNNGYANEPQGIEVGMRYGSPVIFMMWANPCRVYMYQPTNAHKFQSLDLYSTATSNEHKGTCLLPRVVPFYITWNATKKVFEFSSANNVLGSPKNLFSSVNVTTSSFPNGNFIQVELSFRTKPSVFIDFNVNTIIKYSYQGYAVCGNVQYLNEMLRVGIMKDGSPLTNINEIPDGLEIYGTATVGYRLSR